MTPAAFRRMALSFPETAESAHGGHPDFRVRGKVFASLGYPDELWGMVKLTPEEQSVYVEVEPTIFEPARGAWGRSGCTLVRLKAVDATTLRGALSAAWRLVEAKGAARSATEIRSAIAPRTSSRKRKSGGR